MYLCDTTLEFADLCQRAGAFSYSTGAAQIADKIKSATHRHMINDDVVVAVLDGIYRNPKAMTECLSVIRIPWRRAWFEWDDRIAMEVHDRWRDGPMPEDRSRPKRCGFLIETDETGRSGKIWVCWPSQINGMPNKEGVAMQIPEVTFDLDLYKPGQVIDDELSNEIIGVNQLRRYDLNNTLPINCTFPKDEEDPTRVYRTAVVSTIRMQWSENSIRAATAIANMTRKQINWGNIIQNTLYDIMSELMMVFPLVAIMTAKKAVETKDESRSKINKNRIRQAKTELLDHIVVSMNITSEERKVLLDHAMGRGGYSGPRRTHWVVGHFMVLRGEPIWRRFHLRRGIGDQPATKTVLLK